MSGTVGSGLEDQQLWEAMADAAVGHWPPALPLVTMAAYAVAFGLAAARLFRWE